MGKDEHRPGSRMLPSSLATTFLFIMYYSYLFSYVRLRICVCIVGVSISIACMWRAEDACESGHFYHGVPSLVALSAEPLLSPHCHNLSRLRG